MEEKKAPVLAFGRRAPSAPEKRAPTHIKPLLPAARPAAPASEAAEVSRSSVVMFEMQLQDIV